MTPLTKNAHSMFDISSMIQKSIRRGLLEHAAYAANELSEKYTNYMWKRLLTTSAEDCHGLVTSSILQCKDRNDWATAVLILAKCKKNRDADYFICNLFNSVNYMNIQGDYKENALTPNGHSINAVIKKLRSSLTEGDYVSLGYCASELVERYPKTMWKELRKIAEERCETNIKSEIESLEKAENIVCPNDGSSVFSAKAIILLIKSIYRNYKFNPVSTDKLDYSDFAFPHYMNIPDYVYDCHTYKGRQMGRTKEMFVVSEQKSLHPFVKGLFDNNGWERFFVLEKTNWTKTHKVVNVPNDIINNVEYGTPYQQKLF